MSDLVPDNVQRLAPYEPGRPVSEIRREYGIESPIKLASNECARGPSPRVAEAVQRALGELHRYPDPTHYDIRRALSEFWSVAPEEILIGSGSNELIDLLTRTFAGRDAHVVFGDPSFTSYRIACDAQDVAYTAVPLADGLRWDADALLAAVRSETRILFLANPNNPTGAMMGGDELRRLLTGLPPEVMPVLDEAYAEYVTDARYVSALELRDLHPRLVVLRTFSKAYGLAALRVGYGVAPANEVAWVERLRAPFNVNSLAHVAALAALADQDHLRATVDLNAEERRRVGAALEALGFRVPESHTNFLLVETAGVVPGPSKDAYEIILRAGVILRAFGGALSRYLRVSLGTPEENDAMIAAFAALRDSARAAE